MERDFNHKLIVLDGDVQIIYDNKHLSCNRAVLFFNSKTIDAFGDVTLTTPQTVVDADHIILNYQTDQATIYKGYIQSGQILFEGDVIHKTGANQYFAEQGFYTTCASCPAIWSFSGTTIDAEIGGYAKIKNTVLSLGPLPIFWLPYLIVPLKSDRQTGFLFPIFDLTQARGLGISQPFFWAMAKNQDSTWTLSHNKKWTKGHLNYRYVLTEDSSGEFNSAFIRDSFQGTTNDDIIQNYLPLEKRNSPFSRWFFNYNHHYHLPNGYIHRADLNLISDLYYPRDFPEDFAFQKSIEAFPNIENKTSITKNSESTHFSIEASHNTNLLKSNPFADNKDAVHRFPEINFSLNETEIGKSNIYFNLESNYTNFTRSYFTFDDIDSDENKRWVRNSYGNPYCTETGKSGLPDPKCEILRDGIYDSETDIIRAGQRFNFAPRFSYPIKIYDYIDILPSLTYQETHYHFGVDKNIVHQRRTLRGQVSTSTTLSRIFGDLDDDKATRYKHEMKPKLSFTTMPFFDHPSHPFWGNTENENNPFFKKNQPLSDLDLNSGKGIQFDYSDRLYDRELVTLAWTNKLVKRLWQPNENKAHYKQVVLLRVAQSYDLFESRQNKENKKPFSALENTLKISFDQFRAYGTIDYYPYHKVTTTSSQLIYINPSNSGFFSHWLVPKQYQLKLYRNFKFKEDSNTVDYNTRTETLSPGLFWDMPYLDLKLLGEQSVVTKDWNSWTGIAKLKFPGNCSAFEIAFTKKNINKETDISFQFYFSFDGKTMKSLNSKDNAFLN